MTKSNGYCDKISVYSAARCGCKPSSMPRRTGSFADSRRDHFFLRGFTVPGKLAVHVCVPEPVMRKFGFHKIYIPFREKIISKINN